MFYVYMCSIMVKTCKVKVDKETHTVVYDTDEYEKLIYEVSMSVLVNQGAKSKDSSEINKKSFANVPPGGGEGRERRFGNSGGNEDVINITKRQQVSLPHLCLNLPVQLIFCLQ